MKKIQFIVILSTILLVFVACTDEQAQLTNRIGGYIINYKATNTKKDFSTLSWQDYSKKFITLDGIKYPRGFTIKDEGPMTSNENKGQYFPLEIYSTEFPLYLDYRCHFRVPCESSGLQININKTNLPTRNNLKDTAFPNIKSKAFQEKRGRSSQELAEAKKYSIPDNEVREYLYSEYYFVPSKGQTAYEIQVYEREFNGDAKSITEGILSSLHE